MVEVQEAIGNNILAVKAQMLNPKSIFKKIPDYSYDDIKPDKWYPMKQFTLLTDKIEKTLNPAVLMKIGKRIIPGMVEAGILPNMPPEEFIKGLPHVYLQANRGSDIGEWGFISEEPKHIIMKNSTLHNCYLEEGIVKGGVEAFGGKFPRVKQTSCVKNGDEFCTFNISWR
ncbi:MAG: hypothetical protein ACW991_01080 [Candidatus Hodarchaeales archaeon]|jgi:hypothetical protein